MTRTFTIDIASSLANFSEESAQYALFEKNYYVCRALRDIIAFIDGDSAKLNQPHNPEVSNVTFQAVERPECRTDIRRWREIYREMWGQLNEEGLIILAMDQPHSRRLRDLVFIHNATSALLRELERAVFRRLIRAS